MDATPDSNTTPPSVGSMVETMYDELRRLASAKLARLAPGNLIETTSLVHQACLRLLNKKDLSYRDDREFFMIAARAMRDILVENARKAASLKAGGARQRFNFDELHVAINLDPLQLLSFDGLLDQIKSEDPVDYDVVMLRFYSGLTEAQAAEVMGMPLRSLQRRWQYLRLSLYRRLSASEGYAAWQ